MSSAGSISAMISSMKRNSRKKERVGYFDRSNRVKSKGKTESENPTPTKTLSKEELQELRHRLIKKRMAKKRKWIYSYVLAIVIFLAACYYISTTM